MKIKLLAGAMLLATTAANAAIVTEWDYANQAGFISVEPAAVAKSDFQAAGLLSEDTHRTLAWGEQIGGQRSRLLADEEVTGSISTVEENGVLESGDFENGTGLTHENFRIGGFQGNHLASAILLDGLSLSFAAWDLAFPVPPAGASAPELEIAFEFLETPNRPNGSGTTGGTCVDGSAAGIVEDAVGFGCDDFFILEPIPGVTFEIFDGGDMDPSNDFVQFGVEFNLVNFGFDPVFAAANELVTRYEVITRLTGLTFVTDFCGSQAVPCIGFRTQELAENRLSAAFAVRAIPEPSTIAIFGSLLLGLAGYRRIARK